MITIETESALKEGQPAKSFCVKSRNGKSAYYSGKMRFLYDSPAGLAQGLVSYGDYQFINSKMFTTFGGLMLDFLLTTDSISPGFSGTANAHISVYDYCTFAITNGGVRNLDSVYAALNFLETEVKGKYTPFPYTYDFDVKINNYRFHQSEYNTFKFTDCQTGTMKPITK